ncbi:hypothetical protein EN904_14820 [Mesorhizobium sp. M7A.F.Ca.CA.001.07.2.1]|uniref:hypothetical protein n=3 Tax=Phyllobacteriaceae TaxID=69277 RepID=UPI000FC9E5CD|nr:MULTISPECIES: hypothetical protein [Mesorhizobium]MCF6124375.1 hypothetical protein [Mesorhizobium ciceri]MCQ8816664.1 hypothetical protein [Mesorhizobium sp. SEMIA396]RUX82462.1 hypothetical protein EN983_01120 [Mesorhizobium sp. M7A.F.Ca.CA.004.08.2.1]RUX87225.1 hypothetical protein EN982_11785 [Mesorhizobium sp. M7A.F.Ca.CA.004.08.1.1]RUY03793.1 hypothetical protein EN985_15310 [Mesorhizobium sp. M7A.F.Ca.CA.004.04.1.1]
MTNALVSFPVFDEKPSDDYVDRWLEFTNATGHPERFENVTTTKPEIIGTLRFLSGEIEVPIFKRENQDMVPCPICHPTGPWFKIGRMAFFPDERVVRFIGHDCAKRHYKGEFDIADERYRKEARIRHLQRRWTALAENVDRIAKFARSLAEPAKALEDLRAEIDKKESGLSKLLSRELSRNSGRIEIQVDSGVKDTSGNAVIVNDVLGLASGSEFWGRPYVPYQQLLSLQRDADDLKTPLPVWRSEELDSAHEEEIVRRGTSADMLPERLDDLAFLLIRSQNFFAADNLALLERWGKNTGSPFTSLICRVENDRLVIASNTFAGYHRVNPVIPFAAVNRSPLTPSEILTLRRPQANNRSGQLPR